MIYRLLLFFGLYSSCICLAKGGIQTVLDQNASIMFPKNPVLMDTLGQKVFSVSDPSGYYSAMLVNISSEQVAKLDRSKFYKEMYEKMQDPSHGCILSKESAINFTDILGVEFYTTCQETPDFPEIRYKRFFLFKGVLYILDFWTFKNQNEHAASFKTDFFNSFQLKKDDQIEMPESVAILSSEESSSFDKTVLFAILIPIVVFLLIWFFFIKKAKK